MTLISWKIYPTSAMEFAVVQTGTSPDTYALNYSKVPSGTGTLGDNEGVVYTTTGSTVPCKFTTAVTGKTFTVEMDSSETQTLTSTTDAEFTLSIPGSTDDFESYVYDLVKITLPDAKAVDAGASDSRSDENALLGQALEYASRIKDEAKTLAEAKADAEKLEAILQKLYLPLIEIPTVVGARRIQIRRGT